MTGARDELQEAMRGAAAVPVVESPGAAMLKGTVVSGLNDGSIDTADAVIASMEFTDAVALRLAGMVDVLADHVAALSDRVDELEEQGKGDGR